MRRIVVRLMVSLMVGVVVTVLVAWSPRIEFTTNPWMGLPGLGTPLPPDTPWPTQFNGWPPAPERVLEETPRRGQALAYQTFIRASRDPDARPGELLMYEMIAERSGWPMRALVRYKAFIVQGGMTGIQDLGTLRRGWLLPASWQSASLRTNVPLPLMPLWPGFLVNTLFYSALVFGTLAGLSHLKRQRRLMRGLCVQCAYPVAELNRCPECGELPLSQPPRV